MRRLLDILSSRRVSIALMIFVAVSGAVGAWIPQRGRIPQQQFDEWTAANPTLSRVYTVLGFDRVFSTWWFRLALVVFMLSLLIATWRMIRVAWRRTRAVPAVPRTLLVTGDADAIVARARARGYREYSSAEGLRMLWRHRSGVWGVALMHLGMVVALASAALALSCTTRAVVDLSAGEVFELEDEYLVAEGGVLNEPPRLGTPMRLDSMETETWPDGQLKTVTARIALMDEQREWVVHDSTANAPLRYRGHIIYVQPGEFGEAAYVQVTDPAGAISKLRLEFGFVEPTSPAYTEFPLENGESLQARWDPFMVRGDKPLAIRIEGADSDEPLLLEKGETASAEGYEYQFMDQGQWARLIIVRPFGIDVLFVGFAIVGLGSIVAYAWIPRQLVIAEEPDGSVRYSWRALRMARAFDAERDDILQAGEDA